MGRKSSITQLDPRIQEAVHEAVRDGRATIDQIVELIREMGGEVSRSAAGRYVKNVNAAMAKYKQARDIATVWIEKMGKEPDGDVGRLGVELVRTVAFQQLADLGESPTDSAAMEVMLLAKALDHAARSQKVDADRILKIQEKASERAKHEAANQAVAVAKRAGASDELIETIKRRILGLDDDDAAPGPGK